MNSSLQPPATSRHVFLPSCHCHVFPSCVWLQISLIMLCQIIFSVAFLSTPQLWHHPSNLCHLNCHIFSIRLSQFSIIKSLQWIKILIKILSSPIQTKKTFFAERGRQFTNHPGNILFNQLVTCHLHNFYHCFKDSKNDLCKTICNTVVLSGGRFLHGFKICIDTNKPNKWQFLPIIQHDVETKILQCFYNHGKEIHARCHGLQPPQPLQPNLHPCLDIPAIMSMLHPYANKDQHQCQSSSWSQQWGKPCGHDLAGCVGQWQQHQGTKCQSFSWLQQLAKPCSHGLIGQWWRSESFFFTSFAHTLVKGTCSNITNLNAPFNWSGHMSEPSKTRLQNRPQDGARLTNIFFHFQDENSKHTFEFACGFKFWMWNMNTHQNLTLELYFGCKFHSWIFFLLWKTLSILTCIQIHTCRCKFFMQIANMHLNLHVDTHFRCKHCLWVIWVSLGKKWKTKKTMTGEHASEY